MTKEFGTGVGGWHDPRGRNWETTVFQASKPVLDKELNLAQDSKQDMERRIRLRSFTSGWISEDILDSGDMSAAIFLSTGVPDELTIRMVLERLEASDCAGGVIFDGFPRNLKQAEALDGALAEQNELIDKVIYIKVGE